MNDIFVRLFVDATSTEAGEVAERLCHQLQTVAARVRVTTLRPYWKISGYQEICLSLSTSGEPTKDIVMIASRLGTGWAWQHACEAIWNPREASTFTEPLVRWALVEVLK